MKINVVYELPLLAKLTPPERDKHNISFQFFEGFTI